MRHGLRAARTADALVAAARSELADRRAEIAADLGGDLSTLRSDLVERYLASSALLEWLEGRLLVEGTLTTKGRKRAALDGYLALLDRATRLAQLIGLERRSKPAPSVAQYLAAKRAAGDSE